MARRLITLLANEISLAPGEQQGIDFEIKVPPRTTPGEYVAYLVTQEPNPATESGESEGGTSLQVQVVRRVGVAVVIEVPGARRAALEAELLATTADDEDSAFVVQVSNPGSVLVRAEGELALTDAAGVVRLTVAIRIGTVLPGEGAAASVPYDPSALPDGEYALNASLTYSAVLGPESGEVGGSGVVAVSIRNGAVENSEATDRETGPADAAGDTPDDAAPAAPETTVRTAGGTAGEDSGGSGGANYFVAPLVGLGAAVAIGIWWRRRHVGEF